METKQINGGWYCDATLLRDYGAIIGDKGILINKEDWSENVIDNVNQFANPLSVTNNLLFFRLHRFSNLFFGGKGHQDGRAWIKNVLEGNVYHDLGPTHGNSPICFWKEFVFVVSNAVTCDVYALRNFEKIRTIQDDHIGSQGIRYVQGNGMPVWGDATYAGRHAEYTQLWNATIGQSYIGGASLIYDEDRRIIHKVVEPGNTTFIRAYQEFDDIAVAIVKPGYAKFCWFKWSERAQLPEEVIIPEPKPEPKPDPKPEPLPVSSQVQDLSHIVITVIDQHPEVDRGNEQTRGAIVDYFCIEANKLDPRKPWGRKARNADGSNKNTDAAVFKRTDEKLEFVDILNGNPPFGASWGVDPKIYNNGENGYWVPVGAPSPTPVPKPLPNPGDGNYSALVNEINIIKTKLAELDRLTIKHNDDVGLKSDNNHFLCAESGGGLARENQPVATNRTEMAGWETWKIIKGGQ